MTNYDFIKEFNKIKVSSICERLKINRSNISNGNASDENMKKVKLEITKELLELFKKDNEDLIILTLYNELLEKVYKENKNLKEML